MLNSVEKFKVKKLESLKLESSKIYRIHVIKI